MAERRVVITGLGVITPLGNTVEEFWQSLVQGKSGIGPITLFDASEYPVRFAGEVKNFDPLVYLDKREARRMDRYAQFALAAAKQAVADAGLMITEAIADRVGVCLGSGIGGVQTWEDQHRTLLERGPERVSPFFIPMMICDIAAGLISITFNARGPNLCLATACATGNHSIGEAYEHIRLGNADVMIAGGSEAGVCPTSVAGFSAMKALSTRNEEPQKASRPFDAERDGFVLGEGAGVVVLEERDFALRRGARIYAELVGYGLTADAHHITQPAPCGAGAARSMQMALQRAGLQPEEVDYINAHGTSTPAGDVAETQAIKQVFKDHAYRLAISSTKSMTGHLLGAAGGVEFVATVLTIVHHLIPPTINLEHPDPECDLDYVPNQARQARVRVALSNAFGFGGHNSTLIVKAYE